MRSRLFVALLAIAVVYPGWLAADIPGKKPPPPWLARYLLDVRAVQTSGVMRGSVKFVTGNDFWQPGKEFKDGSEWLALACTDKGCSFEPATLIVKDESRQGHNDDQPTAGQYVLFKQAAANRGQVIAWFQKPAPSAWLKAGVVATYYSAVKPVERPATQGTLEALVNLPGGGHAVLVPMLLQETDRQSLRLQLRSQGKRQLLLGEFGSCEHVVHDTYLQWVGDMDSDGRPDYLISFSVADGPAHLYLSSAARSNQLAGLAGIYEFPPSDGECDGSGWLQ